MSNSWKEIRDAAADNGEWLGGAHGEYVNKAWKNGADFGYEQGKKAGDKQLREYEHEAETVREAQERADKAEKTRITAHYNFCKLVAELEGELKDNMQKFDKVNKLIDQLETTLKMFSTDKKIDYIALKDLDLIKKYKE